MFLKNDKIVATIKDVTMRSFKVAGLNNQYVLDPTAVVGWTDGTAARRSATPRPTSHGDFSDTATMSARVVSFTGTAIAGSPGELQDLRDRLIGALADGKYTTLSVETQAGIRYATVGLEGTPAWTRLTDTAASFKIDMYSPTPYIYGAEKKTLAGAASVQGGLAFPLAYPINYNIIGVDTTQVIQNLGNAPAYPQFVVTGDYFSGFSISDTLGNTVKYDGMVTFSSPVTIDMARGVALQNNVDKTTLVSRRDWFAIPAKSTIQPTFVPTQNGSGWCDIIYRDTWI